MIGRGVIVDTSVWIAFFQGKTLHESQLVKLIEDQRVFITGIIMAELLQGIKNVKEEMKIAEAMSAIPSLEITNQLWIKTGKLSAELRQKGFTVPLTDTAIAVLAMNSNTQVYTFDKHFEAIPGLQLYKV